MLELRHITKHNNRGLTKRIMDGIENTTGSKEIQLEDCKDFKGVLFLRKRSRQANRVIQHRWDNNLPFIFVDTGYFLNRPKSYHRMIINHFDMQNLKPRPSDRYQHMLKIAAKQNKDITLKPWQKTGSKILLCPPSDKSCLLYNTDSEKWIQNTTTELKKHTDREIVIRFKPSTHERQAGNTLQSVFSSGEIFAVVSLLGAAAVEAAMAGIPVFVHEHNAAKTVGLTDLSLIENPVYPDREQWLYNISYCQFNIHEIENGIAWNILKGDL